MKLRVIIFSILMFVISSMMSVNAEPLPLELKNYLIQQKVIPTIRHDGVVVYNKDVMYIPVFPAHPEKADQIKITETYPKNQNLLSFPDIIVFNNNFGLLRVVKLGENRLTVRNLEEYPEQIKTGAVSQDLMVPRGLMFPENLAGILGDVYIPLIGGTKSGAFVSGRKAPIPSGKRLAVTKRYNVPKELKNKLFFVNNYKDEYIKVFSSTVSEPLYSLKTSGVMKDVKPAMGGKYLVAATKDQKNLDIIDVTNEYILKHIDLTATPSEIAVDDSKNRIYVSSVEEESLSVIDLNSLRLVEKIQLAGAPKYLCVSKDGSKIAYMDILTSNIFILELDNNYSNKLITNYPNTSKILLDENVIYLISRTEPKLRVVAFNLLMDTKTAKTKKEKKLQKIKQKEQKQINNEEVGVDLLSGLIDDPNKVSSNDLRGYATSIKDISTGIKPVDMYKYNNNVFVLCAGDNSVYKYDTINDSVESTKLPVEGFSRSFSHVPDSNFAVITNMGDLKYVIYDMEESKALQTVPISDYVNSVTILERHYGQ